MLKRLKANTEASDTPSLRIRYLRAFGRDEDGGIIVLTLLLLITMLVMGGMAVDFMRYESKRVLLQSVSDRAVLAAAELDQDLDSEQVVIEYFRAAGLEDAIVGEPTVITTDGTRSVYVQSELDINTVYLGLIGIDQLDAPAQSTAIEGVGNVEISLVLDISGSMGGNVGGKSKIRLVRDAATNFVNTILEVEDGAETREEDDISISLISYSQHVNIGDELYSALNTTPDSIRIDGTLLDSSDPGFDNIPASQVTTNPSRCVDFEADEYATTVFDTERVYEQIETYETGNNSNFRSPMCPTASQGGMILLSQNPGELEDAIETLVATNTTSIHLGMKWAVSLLDPSMRGLLAEVDGIDPAFAGKRPLSYENDNDQIQSVKYVILMTDGENYAGTRLRENRWYTNDFYLRRGMNTYPYNYWRAREDHPTRNNMPQAGNMFYTPHDAAQQDIWLKQSCDAAKAEGIIVFAIAMGAPVQGQRVMQDCASSENHYYNEEGPAIDAVFQAIADQIRHLRLSL